MKKYVLVLVLGLIPSFVYSQVLDPQQIVQAENIQIFSLSTKAATSKLLRVSDHLIVENYTNDFINLKVLGLCHSTNEWKLLGVTGDLVPYQEAKKYSTFSKKYYGNIYKSPYDLTELDESINGNFLKIAFLAKSGQKYRARFQHVRSDLIIGIFELTSDEGVLDDTMALESDSIKIKSSTVTITSDW